MPHYHLNRHSVKTVGKNPTHFHYKNTQQARNRKEPSQPDHRHL